MIDKTFLASRFNGCMSQQWVSFHYGDTFHGMRIHFPGMLVLKKKQNGCMLSICTFSTGERIILQRFRVALIIVDSLISRRNVGNIISFGPISASLVTISLTVESLIICWTLWQIKSSRQTWLTSRNIRFEHRWIKRRMLSAHSKGISRFKTALVRSWKKFSAKDRY